MPRLLRTGETVHTFTVIDLITTGSSARIYRAMSSDGRLTFLKQYNEPTPKGTPWYERYVGQMDEIYRRIAMGSARPYCLSRLLAFEATVGGHAFYQAFELIERGMSLE